MCTADESEIVADVGDTATLNCSTLDLVDWWYQQSLNSSIQHICSAGVMVNGFEEDGRYSLLTDGSLVIDNVTIHNSGFYSCRVTEHGVLRILRLDVRGK